MTNFWCSKVEQAEQVGEICEVDQEEDQTCAICFESQSFIALPCACKLHYCASCWDRCLATSAVVRGQPSCPSCRQSFTVDYNEATGGLIFSTASEGAARAGEWKRKLCKKSPASADPVSAGPWHIHVQSFASCKAAGASMFRAAA